MKHYYFQIFFACCLSLVSAVTYSHESRPILIDINESTELHFSVQWKIPVSVLELALPDVIMPEGCQAAGPEKKMLHPDSYVGTQNYRCEQGLSSQELGISFPIINPSVTTMFQVHLANGENHTKILKPGEESWIVPEKETAWGVAREYLRLGMQHIFEGIDHLLFVACLIFIARSGRRILITITGFTLAHSLTLVLSTLQLVTLPIAPVEAVIALSIVFLAHEITTHNQQSWTWQYPVIVSSTFGLLHGFGFASVLSEIGLPQTELPMALLFFNIGVEIGQILFVLALAAFYLVFQFLLATKFKTSRILSLSQTYAGYVIGSIASLWLIERIAGF